jgi:hypothetical protein
MAEVRSRSGLVAAIAGVVLLGGVALLVVRAQQLSEGPVPVAWDRESCAHCHMHVGDPAFAAQLHATDGQIHHFDDPGCLLLFKEERRPDVHATWFHHVREDRWIAGDDVGFAPASPTPMGYGLGAVDRQTPGTLAIPEALAQVQASQRTGERGHP